MAIGIGRRQFIAAIGGATVAWPLTARAQDEGKLRTIGVLGDNIVVFTPWLAAFDERMRELGWIEGRTVAIERRWSEGRPERAAEIAAEFVRLKVEVIVTYGGAVPIIKQATASIPIVFALAVDPLGTGLVASLSRPGGTVTGMSLQVTEIGGKRFELFREIVPGLRRLAIMFDGGYAGSVRESGEVQAIARKLGLEVVPHEIRRAEDIAPVFDALKGQTDALYVVENALMVSNRALIVTLALKTQLPTTFAIGGSARAGGLMAYGPDIPALFRGAAAHVDKILRGTNPGDLPVEQPTKFDLVINLKTAKALGLTVPDKMLAIADEVIE
jgi:putative tryptophan/tyrosine transport system substrate-binding protein